ncbi:MAG: hypothetical protein O9972_62130 [Burkholderiales bacterium]|nr:hypothetical protein [Burkholderiales bacterium]
MTGIDGGRAGLMALGKPAMSPIFITSSGIRSHACAENSLGVTGYRPALMGLNWVAGFHSLARVPVEIAPLQDEATGNGSCFAARPAKVDMFERQA